MKPTQPLNDYISTPNRRKFFGSLVKYASIFRLASSSILIKANIKALLARCVMFSMCEKAIAVSSRRVARNLNLNPAEVEKDWLVGLLPEVQPVPSGVLALNRAQERGASYCYAG